MVLKIYIGTIQLVAGRHGKHEGRIEVLHRGVWGTVCKASFDMDDANVVCKQMGFIGAMSIKSFGKGYGRINFDDLNCTGTERSLIDCPHTEIAFRGGTGCNHKLDVGVICACKCHDIYFHMSLL